MDILEHRDHTRRPLTSIFETIFISTIESNDPTVSLESDSREYEVEVYVSDLDVDAIASESTHTEHQEQWGIYVPKTDQNASDGSVRVRRTLITYPDGGDDGLELVLTVKTKVEDGSRIETNTFVGHETFIQFRMMADSGLIKTRYFLPFTHEEIDFVAEVDVFSNGDGEILPWIKVDIEYPKDVDSSSITIDPSVLPKVLQPASPDKVHVVTPEDPMDSPVRKEVAKLYKQYFTTTNVHL